MPTNQETETSTKVIGYFNPHSWPVNITSSRLGLNMTVKAKQYVLDRDDKKINDPRLEPYVGAKMLAKELSQTPVSIRWIGSGLGGPQVAMSPASGFSASNEIPQKSPTGGVIPMRPGPVMPPGEGNPVRGMTIEEAKRLGLVRQTIRVVDGPPDDALNPRSAEAAPVISVAHDIPDKRAKQVAAKAQVNVTPGSIAESLSKAAAIDVDDPALLEKLKLKGDEVTVTDDSPKIDDEPTLPSTGTITPATKKFTCSVDGRGFDYRSQLAKHAKRKYPQSFDVIMGPYPEPKQVPVAAAG